MSGINPVNGYDAAKKIVTGGSVTAVPQTEESTILSGEIYIWEYYNGSDWVEMTNNIVPENAEKVRATGKLLMYTVRPHRLLVKRRFQRTVHLLYRI